MTRRILALVLCAGIVGAELGYQKPPKEVLDVLNAALPPTVFASPAGTHILIAEMQRYPSIADLAQPWIGLAGLRVNPKTNAQQLIFYNHDLRLKNIVSGTETAIALPASPRLSGPTWSPDGSTFAFTNTTTDTVELYTGDVASGKVRRVPKVALNGVVGSPYTWVANRILLVRTVPAGRGEAPSKSPVPSGPIVQEAKGQAGPVRTFQDMLQNSHDEDLFDYYGKSQLATIDLVDGTVKPIGKPAMFDEVSMSPDGNHLLITRLRRPYSYLHYYDSFARDVEVWNRDGNVVHTVARLPLADRVPIQGVPTGPRQVHWLATEAATLLWSEALDGGDPRKKVSHRDRLMRMRAPFGAEPVEVTRIQHRFMSAPAIENTAQVLVTDYDRDKQWIRTLLTNTAAPGQTGREIWSRSINERYKDPGAPVRKRLPSGHFAIRQNNGAIFLEGLGGTPQGDRPFLDRMSLDTLKTDRVFQSSASAYENFVALASSDGSRFITRHESPSEAPNYYLRTSTGEKTAITSYQDPSPQLRRIRKQLVNYKRPDGVDLSFTLYLPPGYKEGTRLPAVVYAYPLEFNDAGVAGQVAGSPQRFTTLAGISHLFYLLAGYAVLDNTSIPIVGDPESVNNTYVEQLTASAKAAIDKGVEMGAVYRSRVGVIGHSYGAFMTANLLAHTDLFKAGVARSGAYNRTLTPFGFQRERRTYWEAQDTYSKMSPFTYAHKIQEPILLIHGQKDNNPGTFPIQSERMYQAIRGNGGTVRYVVLPEESHGYLAKESVEHTLWEMITWFDKYVKLAAGT